MSKLFSKEEGSNVANSPEQFMLDYPILEEVQIEDPASNSVQHPTPDRDLILGEDMVSTQQHSNYSEPDLTLTQHPISCSDHDLTVIQGPILPLNHNPMPI